MLYHREVSENFTSAFFPPFPVNFSSKHLDFGLAFYEDFHVACYATTFCFVELCYDSWGWGSMISVFPSAFFLGFNDSSHPLSPAEGTTVWVTTYKFRVNIYRAYMALFCMSFMAVWYRRKSESWEHQSHIVYVQWAMIIRKPARRYALRYSYKLSKELNNDAAAMKDLTDIMKSSETGLVHLWHSQTWQRNHSLASLNESRCRGKWFATNQDIWSRILP